MSRRLGLAGGILAVTLTGCAATTSQPPLFVPDGALGTNADADLAALQGAAWAFASPANTRNRPVEAARAVIAIEYLPAALANRGRYPNLPPLTLQHLNAGRADVRQALGIAAGALPQAVIDAMTAFENALMTGNVQAALQVLQPPVFTLPPQETFNRLSNLPAFPVANVATQDAQFGMQPSVLCPGCD